MCYKEPADIAELEKMIAPFAARWRAWMRSRSGTTAARAIIAEVRLDMSRFPTLPTYVAVLARPLTAP